MMLFLISVRCGEKRHNDAAETRYQVKQNSWRFFVARKKLVNYGFSNRISTTRDGISLFIKDQDAERFADSRHQVCFASSMTQPGIR